MKSTIFKTVLSVGLAAAIVFTPASLSLGAGPEALSGSAGGAEGHAEIKSKNEVIYGILSADGAVGSLYAVNYFSLAGGGRIEDYGDYTSVTNLTDTSPLSYSGDAVSAQTHGESFYYQGNMAARELPWTFDISYYLDGEKAPPSELSGQSGSLEIRVQTSQNTAVNPAFYESYMLQISVTLDAGKSSDIDAPGATIAHAGGQKLIAFTAMPGTDADIFLRASVRDFSMTGIDISAVPFSMGAQLPNMDVMTDDLTALTDAISDLNDGAEKLSGGAADLKTGAAKLTTGSSGIKAGLSELDSSSESLLQASSRIGGALSQLSTALGGASGDIGLGDMARLPDGLSRLAEGLREISGGLTALKNGFLPAYAALDGAIKTIPDASVSQEHIAALYAGADPGQRGVLDQLVASYTAAQTVKGTYNQVQDAFEAVGPAADTLTASIDTVSAALSDMSEQISRALSGADTVQQLAQLSAGLSELDRSYGAFHSGLETYFNGVGDLSAGYADFHSGLSAFGGGVGDLYGGMAGLSDGTARLHAETADMPGVIREQIDGLLDEYTGADFEPVSFVSPKNAQTDLVQFVLKCGGIEKPEEPAREVADDAGESFWDRLVALFKSAG